MSVSTIAATFSARGATGSVYLRPQDRLTYTLVCSGDDEFIGTVQFQRSDNGGLTWEVVTAYTGTVAEPLAATVAAVTYRHTGSGPAQYRIAVTDYDDETDDTPETSDPIDVTLTTLVEVLPEAVLARGVIENRAGQPILTVTDDGVAAVPPATGLPLGNGAVLLTGAGVPVDYTDGDPVATGQDVAGTGSLYLDTDAGAAYVNTGDAAEPTWGLLAFD